MTLPVLPLSVFDEIGDVLDTHLFSVNSTPITIASLLLFTVGIGVAVLLARWLSGLLTRWFLRRFRLEPGIEFAIVKMGQYLVLTVGLIISLQFLGIDLAAIAVIFGFFAVGIGFGLQNLTANFISGLILLAERPIHWLQAR